MSDINRRRALWLGAAATLGGLAMPSVLRAQQAPRRNISSFTMQSWQDHFDQPGKGAIMADTGSRALHFCGADGQTYRVYPTSVPISEELTRRGHTRIVRKKVGPGWTPTVSQMRRFPDWQPVAGGNPANPLGSQPCICHGRPV